MLHESEKQQKEKGRRREKQSSKPAVILCRGYMLYMLPSGSHNNRVTRKTERCTLRLSDTREGLSEPYLDSD